MEIVGEQTCIDLLDDDDDPIEEVPVAPAPAAALQPVATETEATSSVIDKKSQPTPQETEGEPKAKRKRVVGVAKTKPVELDAEPEPVVATIGDDDETAVAEDQTTTAPEGQPGPAKPVAGPSTSEAGPSTDPDTAGPSTAPSEITRRKKKVYRPDELSSEDDDIQGVEEEEELDKFMSAIESGAHLKDKKLSKELGLDSAKLYAKGDAAYMKGKSKKRSSRLYFYSQDIHGDNFEKMHVVDDFYHNSEKNMLESHAERMRQAKRRKIGYNN